MARPVTLFTGQWADLSIEDLCKKAGEFGYDGLELACWGDHFEVDKALSDDSYCARKRELLEKHDLKLFCHLRSPGWTGGAATISTLGIRRFCPNMSGATAIRPA